jgi:ankyrin repeat protein
MSDEAFPLPKEECNKLFSQINKKDWEKAKATLKRNPNFAKEHCTVPGFYDGRFSSCMPPIHLACALEAPPSILQALHEAYPDGISEAEKTYGRIPLHIAAAFGLPTESLTVLIKLHPKACKVQDDHGRLPLHYACKSHSTLRDEKNALCLLKAYPDSVKVADTNGFLPIHVATRSANSRTVIRMLIRSAPETIVEKTRKGNTAIDCAKNSKFANDIEKEEIVGMLERTVEEVGLRIS